ncbi:MAG: 1-acyl-sn-glycerol-3-phosphate acyltransferase [Planctomycetales bacterium]|nr:1-acyl-sn-glycerol-3-phosphate acyltransferase [Planctomycetales bacterium]
MPSGTYKKLKLLWASIRWLLRRRYRITIDGVSCDELAKLLGPTLVLPNHPAYIDPAVVLSHLRFGKHLRPLVWAGTFRRWFLWPLMRLTDAVEVPDMQRGRGESIRKTVRMINEVIDGVQRGESYLIYPSGRLQRGTDEFVGGARIVSEIMLRCPEVNVVLVRTTGLWGSMFSCAHTGDLPNLGRAFLKAAGWLFAGGMFFVPKRNVSLHIEILDRNQLASLDRKTVNRFLEEWYNVDGAQLPVFVRYNKVLGPRRGKFAPAVSQPSAAASDSSLNHHP